MRTLLTIVTLGSMTLLPLQAATAQDNALGGALIGGGIGAIIGGAATGKAGGAVAGGIIGAASGAIIGSQMEPRRGGYYHYRGDCWRRWRDGSYHRVAYRYCR